jgi:hypothetical protein
MAVNVMAKTSLLCNTVYHSIVEVARDKLVVVV